MNRFKIKEYRDLKIEDMCNKGAVIVSHGKFILKDDDNNKNWNLVDK
jgi:hypothetical protein